MAVTTEKTLWCDSCNNWTYGVDGPYRTDAGVRKGAKSEGWVRKNGEDICATCLAKINAP